MVKLYTFNHQEAFDYGITTEMYCLEPAIEIIEKCDCYERFGYIRHNNDGYYHTVIKLFRLDDDNYIVVYGDSRELFDISERVYVVIEADDREVGCITIKAGEVVEVVGKEKVRELLKYYEESEDYKVYVRV